MPRPADRYHGAMQTPGTIRIGLILADDTRHTLALRICGRRCRVQSDGPAALHAGSGETLEASLHGSQVRVRSARGELSGPRVRIEPLEPLPLRAAEGIELRGVPAGRGFHWHKTIDATYPGTIELRAHERGLIAVNEVTLEDYLAGVITAEMGPDCPAALLEAQAIVARSWLLAMREPKHADEPFDRCGDDCCQRYQGTTYLSEAAMRAIDATRGRVLTAPDGSVLDANYAKSCGGISEHPQAVWGLDKPGLAPVIDAPPDAPERERFAWIAEHRGRSPSTGQPPSRLSHEPADATPCCAAYGPMPEAFVEEYLCGSWLARTRIWCSPRCVPVEDIGRYLGRVDQPRDYFRWDTTVPRETVEQLLRQHVPDCRRLAELCDVTITRRGTSGRAIEAIAEWLDRRDQRRRTPLTSEYTIRQVLHPAFLYSSAILIEPRRDAAGRLRGLHLRGAGWGHGVGLCQIGALGMALAGCSSDEICLHYYPHAALSTLP